MCFPLGLEYVDFCEPYQLFYNEEVYRPLFMRFFMFWGIEKLRVKYVMILLNSVLNQQKTIFSKITTPKMWKFVMFYDGEGCQNLMATIMAGHNTVCNLLEP